MIVPGVGVEPTRLKKPADFESAASAKFRHPGDAVHFVNKEPEE